MALAHSPQIVRTGLVLHLDAANVKSYPGSGTNVTDLSSNGTTCTLINGTLTSADNSGVFTFDGTDDYIGTTLSYGGNNDYTMSCWFKTGVTQRCGLIGIRRAFRATNWYQSQIYIAGDNQSGTSGNHLQFSDFTRFSDGSYVGFRTTFTNTVSVTDNQWKYLAITSNTTGARIHINSVKIDESLSTPSPTRDVTETAPFLAGAAGNWPSGPLGGYYFNGLMTNICFYNRALTAAEISQNFEALRGRYGI